MGKKELTDWAEEESDLVKELRRENAKLRKKLVKSGAAGAMIMAAVEQSLEDVKPPQPVKPRRRSRKKEELTAILHLSDWQVGKVTEDYGVDVARDRVENALIEKVRIITDAKRTYAAVNDIRIYLGGDMVEGEGIFPGQAHEIEQSVFDQAVKSTPRMIANLILTMLEIFPNVAVRTCPGNHGRVGRRGDGFNRRTNWDDVCYETAKLMVGEHSGLDFEVADTWFALDRVYDWGNLIVHGDSIRGGFGGIPFYGFSKRLMGWIDAIPNPWDYLWVGHFHQYAEATVNHRQWFLNGTTESSNVYAQQELAAAGEPCQRLAFFSPTHGRVSDHQLFLRDRVSTLGRAKQWVQDPS